MTNEELERRGLEVEARESDEEFVRGYYALVFDHRMQHAWLRQSHPQMPMFSPDAVERYRRFVSTTPTRELVALFNSCWQDNARKKAALEAHLE